MLRIVCLNVLPGMLLTACVIGICSVNVEAQNRENPDSKQMYSNRAVGYTVPTPYYGTPAMPVFLTPPGTPVRVQVAQAVRADVDVSAQTLARAPFAPVPPVVPVAVESPTPQIIKTTTPITPVPPVFSPVPKVNVSDELDVLYARMAKMQLEKHQLDETLNLVKNIKSEVTRIRTLVDLAEYVSRDKNYQSEAEKLYRLALSNLESLDKKADSPPAPPIVDESAVSVPAIQPPPVPVQNDNAKRGGTGKFPPPSPPRGNGVDGGIENIVSSL